MMWGHSTATSDEESSSPERTQDQNFGIVQSRKRQYSNNFHESSQYGFPDNSNSSSSEPEMSSSPKYKKVKSDTSLGYSKISQKLMKGMGYEEGKGLGANAQGRVEPVQASSQRGRRGLGLQAPSYIGIEEAIPFNKEDEIIEVLEEVNWLPCSNMELNHEDIKYWAQKGPRKQTIDDETDFINKDILRNILKSKTIFDNIKPEDLRRARMRSNPFENIRGAYFLNRAAVKMANMDARTGFMFTNPRTRDGKSVLKENELLYFADVCAGPGGFSEYVLWRKKWYAKGFGFTLKGPNDFKLSDFLAGSPETFDTYYGEDDDGDVFKPNNIKSLKNYVLSRTDGKGVHFMMADGGFSVEGQENIQEILSKQLYLCQCLVALYIVRHEGHFVVKLFDLVTRFSIGLMYLMYHAFDEICIMKPNTSRPANSERYLLCKRRRGNVQGIAKYLFEINEQMFSFPKYHKEDINEIVPLDIMQEDQDFMNYFIQSNNKLGRNQIIGLSKICAYYKDQHLFEPLQAEMQSKCLEEWKLERKIRSRNSIQTSNEAFNELQTQIPSRSILNLLKNYGNRIEIIEHVDKFVGSISYDKYFMYLSRLKNGEEDPPTLFLGVGGSRIFQYTNNSWSQINFPADGIPPKLPAGTLIYGELTVEYNGEYKSQKRVQVLHIIDAFFLGKEPVFKLSLEKRVEKCKLFTKAIALSSPESVRMKDLLKLENFHNEQNKLTIKFMKGGHPAMAVPLTVNGKDSTWFYVPRGIIFLKPFANNWDIAWSAKQNKLYYHRPPKESTFEIPHDLYAQDIFDCFKTRSLWIFDSSIQCLDDETADLQVEKLHAHQIMKKYHQIQD